MYRLKIFSLLVFLLRRPYCIRCETWTKYRVIDGYRDSCSATSGEYEMFAHNVLSCLIKCSSTKCCTSMYNKKTKVCINMKHLYCLKETPGGLYYTNDEVIEEYCPFGWKFLYRSCYMILKSGSRDKLLMHCKIFSDKAHFADVKTKVEMEALKPWFLPKLTSGGLRDMWFGATTNGSGWVWSDGTPVDNWNWANDIPFHTNGRYCMVLQHSDFTWLDIPCYSVSRALCEVDML